MGSAELGPLPCCMYTRTGVNRKFVYWYILILFVVIAKVHISINFGVMIGAFYNRLT